MQRSKEKSRVTYHCENHRHHGQFPVLHRAVVVNMRRPRSIQRDQPPRVYRATKDVLWHELALCPDNDLFVEAIFLVLGRAIA